MIAPGSAFAGIFFLLPGFIVGGILWYLRDARRRRRDPESVSDERLVFSFIVFAVMPFGVLLLVGVVWLLALPDRRRLTRCGQFSAARSRPATSSTATRSAASAGALSR